MESRGKKRAGSSKRPAKAPVEAPETTAEPGGAAANGREDGGMPDVLPEATEKTLREFANIFKLLCDENRLRILALLLRSSELNVTGLCTRLGQAQPAVSHHLALLRVAGLIEARRSGKNNFYTVRTEQFSELLARLLSANGEMPRKIRFHDFTLTYQGR
jgi:ArsR family transcriptional regulator, arsenate/arsenite/antimonite-responsive transcriptional repressor